MKDNLFEILMNFFEKTLTQIKERPSSNDTEEDNDNPSDASQFLFIKPANQNSMRIFTADEQFKFTKAAQQFLYRMMLRNILAPDLVEQVITQLIFSESRFVTLQETKWAIRNTLADSLNPAELDFLDLVLYPKEDGLPLH